MCASNVQPVYANAHQPRPTNDSVVHVEHTARPRLRPLTDFVQVRPIEQFGNFVPLGHDPACRGCPVCSPQVSPFDQSLRMTVDQGQKPAGSKYAHGPTSLAPSLAPLDNRTRAAASYNMVQNPYPVRLPTSRAPYTYPPVHYASTALRQVPTGPPVDTQHVHMRLANVQAPRPVTSQETHTIGAHSALDPEEVERRKKNALASAEFRIRRRERENALRDRCAFLEKRVIELEALLADAKAQQDKEEMGKAG